MYAVSYEILAAEVAPEIYYNRPPESPVNAEQWAEIAAYAITHLGSPMHLEGPLDEDGYDESNDSTQAWNQLTRQLREKVEEPYGSTPPEFYDAGISFMEYSLEI